MTESVDTVPPHFCKFQLISENIVLLLFFSLEQNQHFVMSVCVFIDCVFLNKVLHSNLRLMLLLLLDNTFIIYFLQLNITTENIQPIKNKPNFVQTSLVFSVTVLL